MVLEGFAAGLGGRGGVRRRQFVGAVVFSSLSLGLHGCGSPNEASYRFRMTVEVETPQGLKTGSSVIEVRLSRGMAIGDSSGVSSSLRGEAVVVDLPDGPLFVLLAAPDAGPPLQAMVPDALLGRRSSGPDEVMADTAKLGSTWSSEFKAELPRRRNNGFKQGDNGWPLMVRFGNLDDLASVKRVSPEAIGIKRIVVETTKDDVTTGLGKRLEWLKTINGSLTRRLSAPDPTDPPFSAQLHGRDFSTEISDTK